VVHATQEEEEDTRVQYLLAKTDNQLTKNGVTKQPHVEAIGHNITPQIPLQV